MHLKKECKRIIIIMNLTKLKFFLSLIGVLMSIEFVSAQVPEKSLHLSAYAELGWALSSFHSTDANIEPDFSSVSGVNIGGGINLRFMRRDNRSKAKDGLFGLQAGIHYTKAGFSVDDEKVTGNYICIPISFQYYPISHLYIEAGPEMCMNLGLSPSSAVIQGLNIDLDNHKANDFKIGIGAGYLHEFDNFGPIGISVKYLFGTSKFAENLPWKGNQFRISVFYRFGL